MGFLLSLPFKLARAVLGVGLLLLRILLNPLVLLILAPFIAYLYFS
jgi:hypothetical protein